MRKLSVALRNNLIIMKTKNILTVFIVITIFSSCMMGPNFQKVEIESPDSYRFADSKTDTTLNLKWWDLFHDKALVSLIDSALVNNKDAQIAASRIEESRIYLGYTKADMYPSLSYNGSTGYGNQLSGITGKTSASFSATANMSWEIDFWGKYRRATEAAKAEMFASDYALKFIQISLINEVSGTYYILLDYKRRLQIAERTLESRKESTRIINERFEKGVVAEIDLNQAQIQEAVAAASIPAYERSIAYAENALRVLTGENPKEITIGAAIQNQKSETVIPVGLPSQLLARRPDVLAAEQQVVAQNARIGVAQAMRFPSISLTAMAGMASFDLSAFNASDDLIGSVGAVLFGPIFNFGKNKRRVEIEAEKTKQMKLNYEKTVLIAFRETEDALINLSTLGRELETVEQQLAAAINAASLSKLRYDGGVTSYLEVLESERSLFQIELYHSELMQRKLSAYTNLYKVLGGGWINNN